MKKNILLIGSSGYLGKNLKKALKKNYNLITPNKKKFDITNTNKIKKYLKDKIDFIINLSGQMSTNKKLMKNVIVNGNKNIIKFCKNKKIIVYYLSTSLIYGFSKKNIEENSLKKPINDYAKFKLIAEKEYQKSKINYIIVRLCNIYNGKNNGIIKILTKSIKKNQIIHLTNNNVYRNYIHIDDAINIICKMIKKHLKHKEYNLGFENIKLIELINHVEKKLKIKINYLNKNLKLKKIPSQKISLRRLFNEIKYKPKQRIKDYLLKKYKNELKFS